MSEPNVSRLLARIYPTVRDQTGLLPAPYPHFVLFLSVSDGSARAKIFSASGEDLGAVWRRCADAVRRQVRQMASEKLWLRADWVDTAEALDWRTLRARLVATKRSYFRHGIALDARFQHAFIETELNGNAMLYGGPKIAHCVLNESRFRRYAATRHGLNELGFGDEKRVWTFSTKGAFVTSDSADIHPLEGTGRNAGRRVIERLTPDDVHGLIERSSAYLATQVGAGGRFRYGWHPSFAREIAAYHYSCNCALR